MLLPCMRCGSGLIRDLEEDVVERIDVFDHPPNISLLEGEDRRIAKSGPPGVASCRLRSENVDSVDVVRCGERMPFDRSLGLQEVRPAIEQHDPDIDPDVLSGAHALPEAVEVPIVVPREI